MNRDRRVGYVYILEFTQPLGNERHQAKYYLGWAMDVEERLEEHEAGHGAAITRAAIERGFGLKLVAIIPGMTRNDERRLKNQKNTRRIVDRIERGTLFSKNAKGGIAAAPATPQLCQA